MLTGTSKVGGEEESGWIVTEEGRYEIGGVVCEMEEKLWRMREEVEELNERPERRKMEIGNGNLVAFI